MADYDYIPRTDAQVVDYGTRVTPPPIGPKVTIVGVTDNTDAPLEDPYQLLRMENLSLFDKADGSPSEITRKVYESMQAGNQNIEIYVLSDGSGNRYSEDSITESQRYALLERAYGLLVNHDVDLVVAPNTAIDSSGLAATQNFGWQMANFCYQATKEFNACAGVIGVQPPTAAAAGTGVPSLAETQAHVTALKAFDTTSLQGDDFTIFDGITDSGSDGVPDNFAFWATTDEAIPVGSPPSSSSNIRLDANGNPIDIGAYISVVASWSRYRNAAAASLYPTVGYYNAMGDAAYAGLIATLPPEIATTNQIVPGDPLRKLSPTQVNDLIQRRYVVFWNQPNGYVVASGVTGAHNISAYYRSDFVRLSTLRITHEAIDVVRIVCNPFIGLPNNSVHLDAMENAIDAALGKMRGRGALNGFRFEVISTATMKVLGEVIIELTIIPAFEITKITIQIGLAAA
jgi:hypothetical protein